MTTLQRTAATLLLVALAGCEQSAPAAFDADGAAADAAAVHDVFETPLMQSLAFAAPQIDRETGGVAAEAARAPIAPLSGASRRLSRLLGGSGAAMSATVGELPSEVAGRTFVFDADAGGYVVSDAAGAPPSGVRFQLYAIDPAAGVPWASAAEIGHVDVVVETPTQVRISVADDTGIRLEYRVSAGGTDAESRVQVDGFALDGGARAEFGFDNTIELTGPASGMMRLTQALDLADRHVELDCASVLLVRSGLMPELQVDLTLRGPNGEVGVAGAYEPGGSGSLAVEVNGESYAAVHVAGSEFDIAGAAGEPLSGSAVELIDRVIGARDSGLELFDRLVRPVETLIAP